jgi:hypothetical protein
MTTSDTQPLDRSIPPTASNPVASAYEIGWRDGRVSLANELKPYIGKLREQGNEEPRGVADDMELLIDRLELPNSDNNRLDELISELLSGSDEDGIARS